MAEQSPRRRRVLVALDACEAELVDFEASARIAAGLGAELVGLFVEDSDLLAAADLPVTRLIPSGGRQIVTVDAAAMRRAFRVAAGQSRERLSAVAERWKVSWSFEVTPAARAEEILAKLSAQDLLTLAGARPKRAGVARRTAAFGKARVSCLVMTLREEGRRGQPVTVLFEGDVETLAVGRDLARIYQRPLLVLAVEEDSAVSDERQRLAVAWLGEAGCSGSVHSLAEGTADAAVRRLREAGSSTVVVERRGALGGALDLESLAEDVGASVVIVGGA